MIDCVRSSSFHLIHEYYVEFRSADAYKLVIFGCKELQYLEEHVYLSGLGKCEAAKYS